MNGKTLFPVLSCPVRLAITGALTLGLLAPAGTAIAATTDDHRPGLGSLLGIFGDRDDRKEKRKDRREDRRKRVSTFKISGEIRSVDTADREITIGTGDNRRTVRVAVDAKIWRDGDRARLRDLERGDDARISGEKRNGKLVAERIVARD